MNDETKTIDELMALLHVDTMDDIIPALLLFINHLDTVHEAWGEKVMAALEQERNKWAIARSLCIPVHFKPLYITEDTKIPAHNFKEARFHSTLGNGKLPGNVGMVISLHRDDGKSFKMVSGKVDDVILKECDECWIDWQTGDIHFHDMREFDVIVYYNEVKQP